MNAPIDTRQLQAILDTAIAAVQRDDQPLIPTNVGALRAPSGQLALLRNELATQSSVMEGLCALRRREIADDDGPDEFLMTMNQLIARSEQTLALIVVFA